jgi:HEAT repeat protein
MLPLTNIHAQSGAAGAAGADVPAAIQAAITKLQSRNPRERSDAIMKLRRSDATAAIPALIQGLGSEAEFPSRVLMISSFAPITHSCSPAYTFGGEAAETLARIGQTSDDLLACLKSADWRTRANAARAIGGLKDRRAAGELIAILERNDEPWEAKGNAALALGLIGDVRAGQPLITALQDQNACVRAAAAEALGAIQAPGRLQALIAALKDHDPKVRKCAAGGVGSIGGAAAVEPLIQMLKDEDRTVREIVARALGVPKDPRAVSALVAALKDPYANVQINAAEALGQIKSPEAVDPLLGLLVNDEEAVRGAAATGLGDLGDARALEALVAMVLREDQEIAMLRGLQALAKLGHSGAARALQVYGLHRADWKEWWRQNKEPLLNR